MVQESSEPHIVNVTEDNLSDICVCLCRLEHTGLYVQLKAWRRGVCAHPETICPSSV